MLLGLQLRSLSKYRVNSNRFLVSAISMIVACASFPFGWNSDEFRKICGPDANRFDVGLCGIRWAYALAIIGKTSIDLCNVPLVIRQFFSLRRRLHFSYTRIYPRHSTHSTSARFRISKNRRNCEQCLHYWCPLPRWFWLQKVAQLKAGVVGLTAPYAALVNSRRFYLAVLQPERHKSSIPQSNASSSVPALELLPSFSL